jgi:integrase
LSISVGDIISNGVFNTRIYIQKKNFKGKVSGRSVLFSPKLKDLALQVINGRSPDAPLFEGYLGRAITKQTAYRVITDAAKLLQLTGKIGTHSMRKTFADKVYKATDKDIVATAHALGHSDVNNTMKYLSFLTEDLDSIILDM